VLGLGGDHSVSLPLLRAAAAAHGRLSLLQLDAHTDTWDSYFGSKLTHGTMFRRAVEEEIIDAHSSVQIGLRGSLYSPGDYAANAELGFTTLLARDFDRAGVDGAVELAVSRLRSPVYITVDVDCLDPAFAPGTGTPEAGGSRVVNCWRSCEDWPRTSTLPQPTSSRSRPRTIRRGLPP
jgi:agmatinase